MRIGILTFHSAHNYGAILQAYALRKIISKETGNDVEIINFDMPEVMDVRRKRLDGSDFDRERYQMFEGQYRSIHELSSECLYSEHVEDFRKLVEGKYDTILVGSDEVWAVDKYKVFPTPFWLPGDYGCKKLSYAVSSRTNVATLSEETKSLVKEYLSGFSILNVRDMATKELVESITGREARIGCDPTFAYDFRINKDLGKKIIKDKYDYDGKKKIIGLMVDGGLGRVVADTYKGRFDFVPLYNYVTGLKNVVLPPFEWLQVIAGCDGLITSYFHGTIFALKGNTPFISFETRKLNDRKFSKMYDLLHRHGLDKHFQFLGDVEEQSLREVGTFLADVYAGKAESDFSEICDEESQLIYPSFGY